jgi:hypothetical protein
MYPKPEVSRKILARDSRPLRKQNHSSHSLVMFFPETNRLDVMSLIQVVVVVDSQKTVLPNDYYL